MGVITSAEAERRGIPRTRLHRGAKRGHLDRIARGIYLPADSSVATPEWVVAAERRPEATICLTSALALHELTDEIPATLNVAMHAGARVPAGTPTITWRRFDKATFDLGREQIPIPGTDLLIGLYTPERCIVDPSGCVARSATSSHAKR